jgi:tetratricopeptide (TPR) repeat protein
MVGELESAIALFERCLAGAERDEDALRRIQFLVLLGDALVDSGELGRAEEFLGRALALSKEAHDPGSRARLYWTQSRLRAERNEPEAASRYARRALEVLRLGEDASPQRPRPRAPESARRLRTGNPEAAAAEPGP